MIARGLALGAALCLVAACGSDREVPRRVGTGADDLKLSPCACVTIPQQWGPDPSREALDLLILTSRPGPDRSAPGLA